MVKPLVKKVLSKASELGIKTFVDPKGLNFNFYKKAFLLKPNLSEFEAVAGISKNIKEFKEKGERLIGSSPRSQLAAPNVVPSD